MEEPAVLRFGRDAEGHVAHPQAWMAALLTVSRGTTPILLQEHEETPFGRFQVFFGVHGPQERILRNAVVEDVNQLHESIVPAHGCIEAVGVGGLAEGIVLHQLASWTSLGVRVTHWPSPQPSWPHHCRRFPAPPTERSLLASGCPRAGFHRFADTRWLRLQHGPA